MYGSRSRLGLITPSVNTTTEPELQAHVPDGTSVHSSRVWLQSGTTDELETVLDGLELSSTLLASADVDVIVFGCTSGSFFKGDEIEARISDCTDGPAVTTATSIRRALDVLDAERVSISTPYTDELNEREAAFMEHDGRRVVNIDGLGIEDGLEMAVQSPQRAYRQAVGAHRPNADVHLISCANYRTFEIIEPLETDLGKPVVTSNQVVLWDALEKAGIDHVNVQLGTLFDRTQ